MNHCEEKQRARRGCCEEKAGGALRASNAPEHRAVGVDDRELADIAAEFSAAAEAMVPDEE